MSGTIQTPDMTARAFEIADEAMAELVRGHGVPIDGQDRWGIVDENSVEVATMEEADPVLRDAYDWLSRRGVASLEADAHGTIIVLQEAGRG